MLVLFYILCNTTILYIYSYNKQLKIVTNGRALYNDASLIANKL